MIEFLSCSYFRIHKITSTCVLSSLRRIFSVIVDSSWTTDNRVNATQNIVTRYHVISLIALLSRAFCIIETKTFELLKKIKSKWPQSHHIKNCIYFIVLLQREYIKIQVILWHLRSEKKWGESTWNAIIS